MTASHVLVPVEPTEAMIEAAADSWHDEPIAAQDLIKKVYAACLAAAPPPPEDATDRAVVAALSIYSPNNPILYGAALNGAHAAIAMTAPDAPDQIGAIGMEVFAESANCSGEEAAALRLAKEYAANRDWNGAYNAMRVAHRHKAAPREKALEEALRECADDLEALVRQQWGYDERLAHKLKRDLAPVDAARALLGERK